MDVDEDKVGSDPWQDGPDASNGETLMKNAMVEVLHLKEEGEEGVARPPRPLPAGLHRSTSLNQ